MAREPLSSIMGRALRLRCPRCGEGRLFAGWFHMETACTNCNLHYERAPGYFLGSMYFNYGLTALTLCGLYLSLHFGAGYSNRALAAPLTAYCIVFPSVFFRYARSLWIGMDCFFDTTGFEEDRPPETL